MTALKAVNTNATKTAEKAATEKTSEIKNTAAEKEKVENQIIITEARDAKEEKPRTLMDVARDMDMCKKKVERCNGQLENFETKLTELNGKKAIIEKEVVEYRENFKALQKEMQDMNNNLMGVQL